MTQQRHTDDPHLPEQHSYRPARCPFFSDAATARCYTLSLHDALPISHISKSGSDRTMRLSGLQRYILRECYQYQKPIIPRTIFRSEEHTSELQSRFELVCRLPLETKTTATRSRQRSPTPSTQRLPARPRGPQDTRCPSSATSATSRTWSSSRS